MAQSWHQTTSANVNYNEERGDYTESPVTTTKSPEEHTWILLRQETGFAHAASTDVRTGIRKLLSDAPNRSRMLPGLQEHDYTRGLPMSIFRVHTRTEGLLRGMPVFPRP